MKLGCIANCFGSEKVGIDEFLRRINKVGFKYLEVSPEIIGMYLKVNKERAKKAKRIIENHGITSLAYCIAGWSKESENIERGFETAVTLGVDIIVGCADRKVIDDIDKLCNKYRVYFAIENHWKHPYYEFPNDLLKTFKETSSYIGVNIDTGHFASSGFDPIKAAVLLKERIYHVHLKDIKEKGAHNMCILGEGISNIGDFIKKMKELNYNKMFSIEAIESIKPREEVISDLIKCRQFCEKFF